MGGKRQPLAASWLEKLLVQQRNPTLITLLSSVFAYRGPDSCDKHAPHQHLVLFLFEYQLS